MVAREVSLGMGSPLQPILRKKALLATYREFGNVEGVSKFFCATARSLVPFIVYVASRTFFNAEALLGADRSAILTAHPLLEERKVVRVAKGRAGKLQRRSFDARRTQSVPNILERVLKLTAPLVPHAQGNLGKRLFLFRKLTSPSLPQAYIDDDDKLDTWFWHTNLRAFREQHALPYFTLGNLRHTGSDRTHEASGGNLKASQVVLGHMSADTTYTHYRSDGMKRRDEEKIAGVQTHFVDWLREGAEVPSAIVVRDIPELTAAQAEAISVGANAVSSGFTCRNPLDSPMPGQRRGRLCSAWLGCFACPNALIERNAQTLARLLQLKFHLIGSKLNLSPERFQFLYEPKLRILSEDILPRFTDGNMYNIAQGMIASLAPLPDIE